MTEKILQEILSAEANAALARRRSDSARDLGQPDVANAFLEQAMTYTMLAELLRRNTGATS